MLFLFSCSVVSDSSQHRLQHARPPCPPLSRRERCPLELLMSSKHLVLFCPILPLPSIFPRIRIFSNESALHIRWPKYWSFSFRISPSNEYLRLISFRMDWLDLPLQSKGLSRVFSNTKVQKHQFFRAQLSLWSNSHICT